MLEDYADPATKQAALTTAAQKSELGQTQKSARATERSALPLIVLQNSFWVTEDKFSEPWVWRSNNYVGDYATVRQTHGRFR